MNKSAFHRSEKKSPEYFARGDGVLWSFATQLVSLHLSEQAWAACVCLEMTCLQFAFVFTLCACVLLSLCVADVCYVRLDTRTYFPLPAAFVFFCSIFCLFVRNHADSVDAKINMFLCHKSCFLPLPPHTPRFIHRKHRTWKDNVTSFQKMLVQQVRHDSRLN